MICKQCKTKFTPVRALQMVCSLDCAKLIGQLTSIKKAKTVKTAQNRELKKAKEAIKTRREWIKDVQETAFNPYIRARDASEPCISCGRFDNEIEVTYGGKWDCGHFLSVGSHPELRFEPLNAARQCKKCNGGSGKYAKKNMTVTVGYRAGLIEKIGLDKVEWLEGVHTPKKYTIQDLKDLKAEYKAKMKAL